MHDPKESLETNIQETESQEKLPETPIIEEEPILTLLDDQINQLQQEVAELKDQLIWQKAENENLRKRQARELENAYKFASERLLKDLLPVIDSLNLGLQAALDTENEAVKQFITGSEMTLTMFQETLARHGIEEINPVGEKFNPELHEAVTMTPSEAHEPNTVIQVTQKGYLLNGRTVRAAQVIVSK